MSMREQHPLGVLIHTTRRMNGWSQDYIGARATEHGYKLSGSGVSALENNPINSVSAKQIRGLAPALGLPERQIIAAFLASMGFKVAPGKAPEIEEVIRADGRLSAEDKRHLLALVKSMRRPNPTAPPSDLYALAADQQEGPSAYERAVAAQDEDAERDG